MNTTFDQKYNSNMTSGESYNDFNAPKVASRRRDVPEALEQNEKTLHHLNGRLQELRERLDPALRPSAPQETKAVGGQSKAATSSLASTLENHGCLAQQAISIVEDLLDRVDV